MPFTKIAAAGIGSTGTVTLENLVVTGSLSASSLTGAASTANVRTNSLTVSGVSTLGNTVVGGGTTQLIVTGDARITGILTIGTSSVTLDGTNNQVNVGTGVTLHHTNGVQVGGNTVHSTGLTVNQINVTGVVTATSFVGSGANLTGIAATTNVRTNSLVVSGITTVAAGSTAAPSLSPTGDSNTGIFFPAADTVSIGEGGVEALRVNDRGQILLGVSGFAAATSPTASYTQYTPLHLIGGTGTNNGSSIFIARNTPSTNAANQDLGGIIWGTNDGAPFTRIASWADGTPTGSSYPGYLSFQTTASGATTPTERVRIDSNGAMGLRSSSPSTNVTTLDVVDPGSQTTKSTLRVYRNTSAAGGSLINETAVDINFAQSTNNTQVTTGLKVYASPGLENTVYGIDVDTARMNNGTNRAARFRGGHGNTDGYGTQAVVDIVAETSGSGPMGKVIGLQIYQPSYDPAGTAGYTGQNVGIRIHNAITANRSYPALQFFRNGNEVGTITTNLTNTAYNTSSDYRLKENIVDLNNAIERIKNIPVHRFNFISDPEITVDGFLAHEVKPFVPEAVTGEKDAVVNTEKRDENNQPILDENENPIFEEVPVYQQIDQSKLVPLLTAALQEALAEIETLKGRLDAAGL